MHLLVAVDLEMVLKMQNRSDTDHTIAVLDFAPYFLLTSLLY